MAGPASSAEALQLSVAFKGAAHSLVLPPGATLADLGAALAAECSVAPATIKLLGGKAGMVKPAERPERTVAEAGGRSMVSALGDHRAQRGSLAYFHSLWEEAFHRCPGNISCTAGPHPPQALCLGHG